MCPSLFFDCFWTRSYTGRLVRLMASGLVSAGSTPRMWKKVGSVMPSSRASQFLSYQYFWGILPGFKALGTAQAPFF